MIDEPHAVSAYGENLPPGELIHFPYTALDHLGVPTYSAALWPRNGEFCNGLGYGTTEVEAMTGAFGELAEVTAVHGALPEMPRVRASYRKLLSRYGVEGVLDPFRACLEAGSNYDHDVELSWVEARRYPDGEAVLVPVEFVATRYADLGPEERSAGSLITPITNGMGAGPSLEHALLHGVLELLQRDGNSVNYRALDRGVAIDSDVVADAETCALLQRLDAAGVEVILKLAATDFGMTNLYVVGYDRDPEQAPHPIAMSACGEAVHPNREHALRKALLEYVAARARKLFNHGPLSYVEPIAPPGYLERFRNQPLGSEEDRSLHAMLDWLSLSHEEMNGLLADPVLAVRSREEFSTLPHTSLDPSDREALLGLVVNRLSGAGFDVLYVDLSPRKGTGDVRVVHAIVPGLEVETMSYGRIGARNLRRLLDRDSDLVGLGAPPKDRSRARRISLTGEEEERLGTPAWLDYAAVERTVGRLYPLYREPGRHVAALAMERGTA